MLALVILALSGVLLLGCGGDGGTTGTGSKTVVDVAHADARDPSAPRVAVVKTATTPDPITVVTDSEGMTVYEFRRDDPMLYQFDREPVPTCYGACAAYWFPLLTDDPPRATGGANASLLGTIRRKDGGLQVTYDGHPLYLYAGDRRPGQTNGQEVDSFGARWHAVEPDGKALVVSGP